jgi:membrane peptidoglycan carboxypeptidase
MRVFAWNAAREKDTIMSPLDSIRYNRQMLQTGFMVMDPFTGAVRAWVGGIDFRTYKFDHVNLNTKRQVGSSIKPFLYSLAIEDFNSRPRPPAPPYSSSSRNSMIMYPRKQALIGAPAPTPWPTAWPGPSTK